MNHTQQKICLVTGANSGIGKEICYGLAKANAHVIMVCRDLTKGQAALEEIKKITGSNAIDLFIADLSSQQSIHTLANTINQTYPRLNVLINNAGLVLSKKTLSVDGIEMTLATNHLAPFLLTQLLQDLLKKSAPSRIINVSSAIHRWGKLDLTDLQYDKRKYQILKAYAQSKLLMNIVTFELARKHAKTDIAINCIHPGAVKTALGRNNANNTFLKLIEYLIKFFFISPKKAAQPIIDLALSQKFNEVTGNYFVKQKAAPSHQMTYDIALAKNVWEISTQLTQLNLKEALQETQ